MREILFRGKDKKSKEWIEGHFLPYALIIRFHNSDPEGYEFNDVFRETVSEFTGLYDKSSPYVNGGKKIFEGDIIRCVDTENCIEFVGEVKYYAEDDKYPAFDIDIPLEEKYRFESNVLQTMLLTGWYIEVIGNKWDNPELLKKEN